MLLGTGLKCNESQCGGGGFSTDNNNIQLFCFVGRIVAIKATLATADFLGGTIFLDRNFFQP